MKIIVGLGNPGEKYTNTRHNIGFAMLDKIQQEFGFPDFSFNKKFNAEISSGDYQLKTTNYKLILVKPQTFMNLSGESVRAILDFYKLTPADIIVLQDDIDIKLGTFKTAVDSRSAGHNGVQNIIDQLGTQQFTRVRLGVGAVTTDEPACRLGAHEFVLGKFSPEEQAQLATLEKNILEEIKSLL